MIYYYFSKIYYVLGAVENLSEKKDPRYSENLS